MFRSVGEVFGGTGWFRGALIGNQDEGAGPGHGIGGKGELDKNSTEGKQWIWRHKLELDGADSSEENMRKGTTGDGGFRGVGGFESSTSHLCLFEKCILDKRILYREWSLIHPIASDCAHDSELPFVNGKSKLQKSSHNVALTGGESFALTGGEKRVERRCDCETFRILFSLEQVF